MLLDFTKKPMDIIVIAGQSNAQGAGLGPARKIFQPKENLWMMFPDFTIGKARERIKPPTLRGRFPLYFAEMYMKEGYLTEGHDLLLVQAAVGGTSFAAKQWGSGNVLQVRLFDMVDTAVKLHPDNKVKAFLWHQGESDIGQGTTAEQQYENVATMLQEVEENIGIGFPLIAGDFVPDFIEKQGQIAKDHRASIEKAFGEKGGVFVESHGLSSNANMVNDCDELIHFSRYALYEFAERYFAKFQEEVQKETSKRSNGNPTGNP